MAPKTLFEGYRVGRNGMELWVGTLPAGALPDDEEVIPPRAASAVQPRGPHAAAAGGQEGAPGAASEAAFSVVSVKVWEKAMSKVAAEVVEADEAER